MLTLLPAGAPRPWLSCPPGLILYDNRHLAVMSEYRHANGKPEAIIVSSGEFLHLDDAALVQPLQVSVNAIDFIWANEDALPPDIDDAVYGFLYIASRVIDGVRMFPWPRERLSELTYAPESSVHDFNPNAPPSATKPPHPASMEEVTIQLAQRIKGLEDRINPLAVEILDRLGCVERKLPGIAPAQAPVDWPKATRATPGPIEHDLKTWPSFYVNVASGAKQFEIRKYDRDYRVGDTLLLREWVPRTGCYTGSSLRRRVTYATTTAPGLQAGFILMSVEPVRADGSPCEPQPLKALEQAYHRGYDHTGTVENGCRAILAALLTGDIQLPESVPQIDYWKRNAAYHKQVENEAEKRCQMLVEKCARLERELAAAETASRSALEGLAVVKAGIAEKCARLERELAEAQGNANDMEVNWNAALKAVKAASERAARWEVDAAAAWSVLRNGSAPASTTLPDAINEVVCRAANELAAAEEQSERAHARLDYALEQRDKLQAFKDFVHQTLTVMGVPAEIDGPHSAQGCRVGDRLAFIAERLNLAKADLDLVERTAKVWVDADLGIAWEGSIVDAMRVAVQYIKDARRGMGALDMYRNAWKRELGDFYQPKMHEIDALVISTRGLIVDAAAMAKLLREARRYIAEHMPPTTAETARGDIVDRIDACIKTTHADNVSLATDAARWRAFIGSARLRMLGSAGLFDDQDGYAHVGLEAWTKHEPFDGADKEHATAVDWLTRYTDIAMKGHVHGS